MVHDARMPELKGALRERHVSIFQALLGIVAGVLIGILVNAVSFTIPYYSILVMLALATLIPMARRLARTGDVFDLYVVFLGLFFLAYCLKPLLLLYDTRYAVFAGHFSVDEVFGRVLLISFLGLFGFYIGYYAPIIGRPRVVALSVKQTWRHSPKRLGALFFVGFVLSVAAWLMFVWWAGGIRSLISSAFFGRANTFQGVIGVTILVVTLMRLSLFSYLSKQYHSGVNFLRSTAFYLLFALTIVAMGSFGGRMLIVSAVFLVASYYHYRYRRLGFRHIALLGLALAFFIGVSSMIRSPTYYTSAGGWVDLSFRIFSNTFDPSDNFRLILDRESIDPGLYRGRIHAESLFYAFIPRFLYPSKRVLWGTWLLQEQLVGEYRNVSFSVSAFAPGYFDFGFPGVFLDLFLLGILLSYFSRKMRVEPRNEGFLLLYIETMLALYSVVLNGVPQLFFLAPFYLGYYFILQLTRVGGAGEDRIPRN